MATPRHHLVLKPSVPPQEVIDLLVESGWAPKARLPSDEFVDHRLGFVPSDSPSPQADDQIWIQTQVHMQLTFLVCTGFRAISECLALQQRVDCFGPADFARPPTPTDDPDTVLDLVFAAALQGQRGEPSTPLLRFIMAALDHVDEDVRRWTIYAAVWLEWPPFIDVLNRMATEDPAYEVREDARSAATELERVISK